MGQHGHVNETDVEDGNHSRTARPDQTTQQNGIPDHLVPRSGSNDCKDSDCTAEMSANTGLPDEDWKVSTPYQRSETVLNESDRQRGVGESTNAAESDGMQRAADITALSPKSPIREDYEPCNEEDLVMIAENQVAETNMSRIISKGQIKPRVTIDLTLDDDEDDDEEADGFSYDPTRAEVAVPRIKVEPQDEDQLFVSTRHAMSNQSTETTFHNLPEIGSTTIPDGFAGDYNPAADEQIENLTSDQMAEMLQVYGINNAALSLYPDEQDSEAEDLRAREQFQQTKDQYEQRKRDYGTTLQEQILFDRLANEEQTRIHARNSRKQHEYDDATGAHSSPLFFPEHDDSPLGVTGGGDYNGGTSNAYTPANRTSTPERVSEGEIAKKAKGRGRPRGGKKKPAERQTAATTSRVSKKQQKSGTGQRRGRRQAEPLTINTNSLLHHDIIAEANANQGQAAQPTFTSKVKKDALAQLISSIPLEERNLYAGDKADLKKATENFNGRGAMKADGQGNWKLKGMKTSLHHYQLLGVSWMRNRENQPRRPRGGILSDDMGFGKTVSALANMVDGRASSTHTGSTATLIVVPPSLMGQWMSEIEKHTEIFRRVIVYRSKMKVIDPAGYLASHDIVITSYHEVVRSLPPNNPPPHIYTAQAKSEWYENEVEENKGALHQVKWHRIVLDEAQAIKNHLSKTSEAICRLKGRYRWCLSGTPIQNALEEFYPYFRFLGCDHTGSFELFKQNFAKRGSEKAIQRLQVFLGNIMLRRTHEDKMFGRPILQLPPIKPIETIEVKFNAVERAIYHIVRHRFVMKVKALSKKDGVENNYQQILVLLLRLRQLVGHPLLIQKTLKELLETEDLERLWSLTKGAANTPSGSDVAPDGGEATAQSLHTALSMSQKPGESFSFLGANGNRQFDNQISTEFRKYLQSLRDDGNWTKANERSLCSACGSPPTQPYITSCLHLYCLQCLSDLQYCELMQNRETATCLYCGSSIQKAEAYAATAFADAGNRRSGTSSRQTPDEDIDWYTIGGPILRSAKVKGAVAKIKEWFVQDPTNKILVFTQFRGMIKIMERVCREEDDWGYASYHGAMSFDYRDEQIQKFTNNPDCRILLAAMKAGGVGLNLTAANRVIILDLWWNTCVESQAFTRCFRIGQKRDVEVVRFVVHNSIDTDIMHMQQRKIAEIEQAMEDKHRPQLTSQELVELFSDRSMQQERRMQEGTRQPTQTDNGEDEPFIFPDDPYDPLNDDSDVDMTGAE